MLWITSMFNCKTLILVNSSKMQGEIKEAFEQFWNIPVSIYDSKKEAQTDIVIATHRMFSLKNWILNFDTELILYDECHLSISEPMIKALCNTKAKALYWFSWTPYTDTFETADLELIFWKTIESSKDEYFYIPDFEFINYSTNYRYESDIHYADLRTAIFEDTNRQLRQEQEIKRKIDERKWTKLILSDRIWEIEHN